MFSGLTYVYIYKIHTIDEFYFNNFSQVLDKEVIRCHTKIKNLEFGNENLEKELNKTVEQLLPLQAQVEDYKMKWTRATAEKNALETLQNDRISSMENNVSMTADDKKELKTLRNSERELKRTCSQLEKLLQKAENRIGSLEDEKKRLLKSRVS
jgi:predicted  nucleic acid-binding Zn-ribbon protein